jgi:hypothetical protein
MEFSETTHQGPIYFKWSGENYFDIAGVLPVSVTLVVDTDHLRLSGCKGFNRLDIGDFVALDAEDGEFSAHACPKLWFDSKYTYEGKKLHHNFTKAILEVVEHEVKDEISPIAPLNVEIMMSRLNNKLSDFLRHFGAKCNMIVDFNHEIEKKSLEALYEQVKTERDTFRSIYKLNKNDKSSFNAAHKRVKNISKIRRRLIEIERIVSSQKLGEFDISVFDVDALERPYDA